MTFPSLKGFLKRKWLESKIERKPFIVESPAGVRGIRVKFLVQTWYEYYNRSQGSYSGEPDMVQWLEASLRPGDVLWDVGANVGAYSILAAKFCPEARVFAFEPFIPTFAHLWENVALNGVTEQVFPLNLGLLDQTGPERLAVSDPKPGSSQHQVGGAGGKISQGVLSFRGEDLPAKLGIPAPTLLKLDIDGLEVRAVAGLEGLISSGPLRQAMIEVEQGKSEEPVEEIFRRHGFQRVPNPLTKPTDGVFNALFSKA